jgi:hypothetical protein
MRWVLGIALLLAASAAGAQTLTDDQVRAAIIKESVASYPGRCPCPWNLAKNGSRCGGRSAWSKPGGYAPICYPNEVTPEMATAWRKAHGT